ncbi:hypothetical protein [Calothrix sp. PCC 7507]|uniref:hypothetical protein n=1 Tax=Calothrix sp. PCC 7507 TaxID=99598 RepID=UPI00029ED57B|nr:hypothetical protein [Calothrix sp. PCC 7507]AFY36041.1 hypothetical protein Cal7507_5720 [Calothrix sp. PCC 7507]
MMAHIQKFVDHQKSTQSQLEQSFKHSFPQREPIKHLLIGSPKAVTSTIHYLQVIGYASVGDWSPLLPTTNSGEVMSILSRQIQTP